MQTLFILNPCKHPIVILKDVRYSDLKTLVDFMYYGEVNVSQERLPHIIKTAEMLKIKGLAEMSDAASLSKSDTKAVGVGDQLSAASLNDGESVWGGHESQHHQQFQQQQQQQPTQQQQQSQLQQQQLQLLHHHHVHQSRRTPSPTTMSPATRRKRLRKSSTGHEFTLRKEAAVSSQGTYAPEEEFRQTAVSGEDQASSMEGISTIGGGSGGGAGTSTNIHIAHLDTMTAFGAGASTGGLVATQRLMKEAGGSGNSSGDMDGGQHSHNQHHNPHQIQAHHDVEVDEQQHQQQHIIMVSRR